MILKYGELKEEIIWLCFKYLKSNFLCTSSPVFILSIFPCQLSTISTNLGEIIVKRKHLNTLKTFHRKVTIASRAIWLNQMCNQTSRTASHVHSSLKMNILSKFSSNILKHTKVFLEFCKFECFPFSTVFVEILN